MTTSELLNCLQTGIHPKSGKELSSADLARILLNNSGQLLRDDVTPEARRLLEKLKGESDEIRNLRSRLQKLANAHEARSAA